MKILAFVLLLFAARAARAQDTNPVTTAQTLHLSATMRAQAERDAKAQKGKRKPRRPLTPAEQRAAHRREVDAAMRRPPAKPGSIW